MEKLCSPSPSILRGALIAVVLATTIVRLVLGQCYFGFHNGDDVEILMAGLRSAFGGDYQPWPIRNLLVPDLVVAPLVRLAARLGVHSTRALVWIATWPCVVAASVNIVLVHRLGRRRLASDRAAALAAALFGTHRRALDYGSTVYPRTLSTTCVLAAVMLVSGTDVPWIRCGWAGAVCGLGHQRQRQEQQSAAATAISGLRDRD